MAVKLITMELTAEQDILLKALKEKRDKVYAELQGIDKVIKQIKAGVFSLDNNSHKTSSNSLQSTANDESNDVVDARFPNPAPVGIQLLAIFDMQHKALKLKEIQDEFSRLTGKPFAIRQSIRTLNANGKVKLMREKGSSRGNYWVRSEWVENGVLLDEYKFDGFDKYYKEEDLEYT